MNDALENDYRSRMPKKTWWNDVKQDRKAQNCFDRMRMFMKRIKWATN